MVVLAFDMGALARDVYGCECEVLDMESTGSGELLLRHLVGGNICLVPYPLSGWEIISVVELVSYLEANYI